MASKALCSYIKARCGKTLGCYIKAMSGTTLIGFLLFYLYNLYLANLFHYIT